MQPQQDENQPYQSNNQPEQPQHTWNESLPSEEQLTHNILPSMPTPPPQPQPFALPSSPEPLTPPPAPQPLYQQPPVPPLAPVTPTSPLLPNPPVAPIAVVRVLSPRGIEYVFQTIALLTGAVSLSAALISMCNGKFSFSVLSVPAASLLVSVPVFAWLFLRLKKAELLNPELRLDASKRRSTQFIQIASFVVAFFSLIGFVVSLFAKFAGQFDSSILKLFLDVLVVEVVAGGLLFYYWRDEHKLV